MPLVCTAPAAGGAALLSQGRPAAARASAALPEIGPAARVFWVAPGGSDAGAGTQGEPFATPERARAAAQPVLAHAGGDVVIVLRGGRYQLGSTLSLGPSDSGQGGCRVRYVAAPGEVPVLSGGVPIVSWRQESQGWLWSAPVPPAFAALAQPAPLQIVVGGVRATRVRGSWPTGGGTMTRTSTGFSFSGGTNPIAGWRNPSSITFIYRIQWMEQHLPVASCTSTSITMQDTDSVPWTAATTMFASPNVPNAGPDVLEHAYELLSSSTSGQFWVDSAQARIYYVPRMGEDLSSVLVLGALCDPLVALWGVQNVSLEGLVFAEGTWLGYNQTGLAEVGGNEYFASGAALRGFLASDQTGPSLERYVSGLPGAVHADACTGLVLRGCTFTRCGGTGLLLSGTNSSCVVEDTTFSDLDGGAILVPGTSVLPGGRISGCAAQTLCLEYAGGDGMVIKGDAATLASHNRIGGLGYIGLDARAGGTYEYNHVHDCMQLLVDGGPLYTYGPSSGLVFRRNLAQVARSYSPGSALYSDSNGSNKRYQNNVIQVTPTTTYAFYGNPALGTVEASYNVSDSSAALLNGAYPVFKMNRVTSGSAPAPATVTAGAGPEAAPAPQCSAPRALVMSASSPASAQLTLSWSAPAQGTASFYEVYDADVLLGTTTGTTFVYADLDPAGQYVFSVRAADSLGGVSAPCAPLVMAAPAGTVGRSTYGTGWE